ncbi:hypothetical protein K1T71_003444 [Dendrolimus kikuchii]|uniref:Uncharacterized protein n=1 Tax=Dendrolimus kikuchii TaxID=765133 RepID=A0ACC1DC98_9NEOP|nr:hypothetical protein K1T71_003444 [Dendrolimus kikuchii]
MKCFVVILTVVGLATAAAAAAAGSCSHSEDFFAQHNASADDSNEPGPVCGGHCCGRGREAHLRSALRRVAEESAAAHTRRTAELMMSTKRTLQEHLTGLSHKSQNKTAVLFTQIYRGHATRTLAPLANLYDDIRALLRTTSEREITDSLNSRSPKDLVASARKFFRDIFPVAYQNALRLDTKQFTPEYEACLKDAYDAVQPFGEVPQQLGASLSQSLEAARVLLEMLAVGAGALDTTEKVLATASDDCSNKLLRAGACARCAGHDARPCRNYCLNVARGCIGSLLAELDGPWSGYVEGVERLTRVDADASLRELETKVSKAIMYALENRNILENKVRQECGPPSTTEALGITVPPPTPGSIRREDFRAPPPDTELLHFAATLASTKKLFSRLGDRLCDETEFADDGNEHCWNGESVAEYTKSLVPSASLSDQKYNPEITDSAPRDSRVASLADRLQQARQLLMSHAGASESQAEAFMQGDEAGEEGSGSGRSYPEDDATYDTEGSGEEGSGAPETVERSRSGLDNQETPYSSTPRTAAAATIRPVFFVLCTTILVVSNFT